MSRSLAFHSSVRQLRREHAQAEPDFVVAGRYNLSAIMREAVKVAKSLRAGGASWSWRMRMGLTAAWRRAKTAKADVQRFDIPHRAEPAAPPPVHPRRLYDPGRAFIRGSRLTSHGW